MHEARAVLRRLARIEALEREDASPAAVLAEVRELLHEAEAWLEHEHDPDGLAAAALHRCRLAHDAGVAPVA